MSHKTVSITVFASILTLVLSGCGQVISGNEVPDSESMDAVESGIGFGPSKTESRVVVEVDSTVYDSYVEKWNKLYGVMVYVEAVTVIMDEISTYTDMVNLNSMVSMKMEYDNYPYGTEKANILITNNTDSELGFGDIEIYEKLVDGVWHTIYRDYFSDLVLCIVKSNSTLSYEIRMPLDIMDLEAGIYRIVKKLGDEYYCAEFSIN